MRPDLDPSQMTSDERRREVAAILAAGLRRLRDRAALASIPPSEIPSDTGEKPLEAVLENPLSVHVG
jgi:hypothetical protein